MPMRLFFVGYNDSWLLGLVHYLLLRNDREILCDTLPLDATSKFAGFFSLFFSCWAQTSKAVFSICW